MVTVIEKQPFGSCRLIQVKAKSLADLTQHFGTYIDRIPVNLGRGLVLVTRSMSDEGEVNFYLNSPELQRSIKSVVVFVKTRIKGLIDCDLDDLYYIENMFSTIQENGIEYSVLII